MFFVFIFCKNLFISNAGFYVQSVSQKRPPELFGPISQNKNFKDFFFAVSNLSH